MIVRNGAKQMSNLKQDQWIAASREQRAAYFAWQNASGVKVAKALKLYVEATKRQLEIERGWK